jgi:hypothetical protein
MAWPEADAPYEGDPRLAVAPPPEPLDVERLAIALESYKDDLNNPDLYSPESDGSLKWLRDGHARAIAAEYARLSQPEAPDE